MDWEGDFYSTCLAYCCSAPEGMRWDRWMGQLAIESEEEVIETARWNSVSDRLSLCLDGSLPEEFLSSSG
jgi:hypothetical protein